MSQSVKKLFELSQKSELPAGLSRLVLAKIEIAQRQSTRRRLFVFGVADAILSLGVVVSCWSLINLLTSSSFFNYLSLLWSDSLSLVPYWQEFLLSMMESLPVLGLMAFLAAMAALTFSLGKTVSNYRLFYYQVN